MLNLSWCDAGAAPSVVVHQHDMQPFMQRKQKRNHHQQNVLVWWKIIIDYSKCLVLLCWKMQFRGTGHQTHTTKKMSCLLFCFALLTINLKVLSTIQHCFQLQLSGFMSKPDTMLWCSSLRSISHHNIWQRGAIQTITWQTGSLWLRRVAPGCPCWHVVLVKIITLQACCLYKLWRIVVNGWCLACRRYSCLACWYRFKLVARCFCFFYLLIQPVNFGLLSRYCENVLL